MNALGVLLAEPMRSERMSIGGVDPGPVHHARTQRGNYQYFFYVKHRGRDKQAARWLPNLSQDEEFAVFDAADVNEIQDEGGWLYGVRMRGADGSIPALGTWGQIVAAFPHTEGD